MASRGVFFKRPNSPGAKENNHEKNKEFVLRASLDDFLDHSLARFARSMAYSSRRYMASPYAIGHMLLSGNLELFLYFFLPSPADNHSHFPLTRHAEIGLGLIKTILR